MPESVVRVDRTERLLNLVFCLMAARRPVPRAAIQSAIPGYDGQSPVAFERMFERDKDELRGMGIPVETVLDANGDVEGYRVVTASYAMEPVDFTPAELKVLALAAATWDEAILGPAATTALRKIEAAQATAGATAADFRMSVQLTARDAALIPMLTAVRERRTVTFEYRGANDDHPAKRRVDPWGVISRGGRWYTVGHDHDRQAPRAFRLSRVMSAVTVTAASQVSPRPVDLDVDALLSAQPEPVVEASIRVAAGQAAQLRRLARASLSPDASGVVQVAADARSIRTAVLAAGGSAVVENPPDMRDEVREAFERVLARHGGAE